MLTMKLTYLQCMDLFTGTTATGSGILFGKSGTNYSVVTSLEQMSNGSYSTVGVFTSYANSTNYGSTSSSAPETLDAMLFSYFPTTSNDEIQLIRFKAIPLSSTFEMHVGANVVNIQPANGCYNALLRAGFRMISDGTYIYSDGALNVNQSTQQYWKYNVFLNASNLSLDATMSDYQTVLNSVTINNTETSLNCSEATGYPRLAMTSSSESCTAPSWNCIAGNPSHALKQDASTFANRF